MIIFYFQQTGKTLSKFFIKFKYNFRLHNPFSSGVVQFKTFLDGNFVIVANLEKMKISEGALQVKLEFESVQREKLVFLWMPVFERKLVIDRNLDVAVE